MNKSSIILIFLSVSFATSSQNNIFNRTKKENPKDDYQYKNFFYSGIKNKSIENFESAIKWFEKCGYKNFTSNGKQFILHFFNYH